MRCLTWEDGLVLLSITVVVDMICGVNARRCFRSLADACLRPNVQTGGGPIELARRCRGTPFEALVPGQGGGSSRLCVGHRPDAEPCTDISIRLSLQERGSARALN